MEERPSGPQRPSGGARKVVPEGLLCAARAQRMNPEPWPLFGAPKAFISRIRLNPEETTDILNEQGRACAHSLVRGPRN